jgi:hypothetical protein
MTKINFEAYSTMDAAIIGACDGVVFRKITSHVGPDDLTPENVGRMVSKVTLCALVMDDGTVRVGHSWCCDSRLFDFEHEQRLARDAAMLNTAQVTA